MELIENCKHCGQCMKKCPYTLNTLELLRKNLRIIAPFKIKEKVPNYDSKRILRVSFRKRITFVGVGAPICRSLSSLKPTVQPFSVRDKRSEAALGEDGEALKSSAQKLICGEDYLESIDEDMLFRAPGVPYLLPELQKARANGCRDERNGSLFSTCVRAKFTP